MAFPTDETKKTLAVALARAQSQASSIKRIAQNNRAAMAAGPVTSGQILSLMDNLVGAKAVLADAAALGGIAPYAQQQLGSAELDISAEFIAMMDAVDACGLWVATNFPKDSNGFLLAETFGAGGARVERTFSSAATAGLRAVLDALIATID